MTEDVQQFIRRFDEKYPEKKQWTNAQKYAWEADGKNYGRVHAAYIAGQSDFNTPEARAYWEIELGKEKDERIKQLEADVSFLINKYEYKSIAKR